VCKLGCVAFTVGGAAVASVLNSSSGTQEDPVLGNIFFFLQCFFGSMFFLLQKSVLDRYPPLQVTAWGYCMGGILMVLVVTPQATDASDWNIHGAQWLAIAYVILVSSALGYALYAWANASAGPTFVAVFGPLRECASPAFTTQYAWAVSRYCISTRSNTSGLTEVAVLLLLLLLPPLPAPWPRAEIVFTALLQLGLLHKAVKRGSIIGGALVTVGLLLLVIGRAAEERLTAEIEADKAAWSSSVPPPPTTHSRGGRIPVAGAAAADYGASSSGSRRHAAINAGPVQQVVDRVTDEWALRREDSFSSRGLLSERYRRLSDARAR
jgi:drug/metabolite transporter (DMT)-like permease